MGYDTVRVVAEDVFAGGLEAGRSVEMGGEVGGKEGPDGKRAEERGTVCQSARVRGSREKNVDCIGKEKGPEEGDGAE